MWSCKKVSCHKPLGVISFQLFKTHINTLRIMWEREPRAVDVNEGWFTLIIAAISYVNSKYVHEIRISQAHHNLRCLCYHVSQTRWHLWTCIYVTTSNLFLLTLMHIHNIHALLIHDASFIRLEFVRKNNHASPPRANKALVLAKMTASQATARTWRTFYRLEGTRAL